MNIDDELKAATLEVEQRWVQLCCLERELAPHLDRIEAARTNWYQAKTRQQKLAEIAHKQRTEHTS